MSQTLQGVEGVTEEMVDRLAALGMISVFDVEEVGPDVLVNELGLAQETAEKVIEVSSVKAKEVAEQQQKDKEAAERKKREDEEATRRLLGEGGALSALGIGGDGAAVSSEADARAADILGGGGAAGDGAAATTGAAAGAAEGSATTP
jgi:N utilization substance protein A